MHSSVLLDVFPMALFVRKNGLRSMKSKPKRIEPSFYVHDWAPFINNPSGFCPLACVDTSSVDTSSVSAGPRVDLAAESIWHPHQQFTFTTSLVNVPKLTLIKGFTFKVVLHTEPPHRHNGALRCTSWQVQGQLAVTGLSRCDFITDTEGDFPV